MQGFEGSNEVMCDVASGGVPQLDVPAGAVKIVEVENVRAQFFL